MPRRVYNPFRLMHEPPIITTAMTCIYLCFALAGLSIVIVPSTMNILLFGGPVLDLIGIATLLSGLMGAFSVWPGIWWMERTSLSGCLAAILIYMIGLGQTGGWDGGVLFREFMVIALTLFLGIRLLWISSLDLDPTKPPIKE